MHSFTIHESRNLKQARPKGQYVDLLRYTLATPSWDFMDDILSLSMSFVKLFKPPLLSMKLEFVHFTNLEIDNFFFLTLKADNSSYIILNFYIANICSK